MPKLGTISLADNAYLKRRCGKGRRNQPYYVRVPVPQDLQELLSRRTIERPLKTTDLAEARRRKHAVVAEIMADFERARRGALTAADIENEAQRYLRERLKRLQKAPEDAFTPLIDGEGNEQELAGEAALADLRDGLERDEWTRTVVMEAENIARRYGATLGEAQRVELCRALQRAEIEALSRALAIYQGETISPVPVLDPSAVDPITAAVRLPTRLTPKHGPGIRVSDAAEGYVAEKTVPRRGAWTGQTAGQARATLRFFEEFTSNRPLAEIARADVAKFLSNLASLDPSYGRRSAYKRMTFRDLLKAFPANNGMHISNKTLNRHADFIANMFEWAIREGKFTGNNPAKGHHRTAEADKEGGEVASRRPFSIDELNKLLTGSLYDTPRKDRIAPKRHSVDTALAWLIPIALFSGMRLDEICGLRVGDVTTEDGILYFDLASHEGRRLKTAAARRKVPVHSELVRFGFADYVAFVRNKGETYLWPALKPGGPDDKRSWYVGKRFTTYRRLVGASASATTFHCLRKNTATALERAHVPENEAVQILGHKKLTMSYGLYSGGLDLPGLRKVVEAIKYPGLKVSRLAALNDSAEVQPGRIVKANSEQIARHAAEPTAR